MWMINICILKELFSLKEVKKQRLKIKGQRRT